MTAELMGYHRQIKKKLDCPKSLRNKFLADARRMTDDFLAENPESTMDDLKSAVGEPDDLAAMFLESVGHDVIERYRRMKIWAKRIAVTLLVLAFVSVTAFSIYAANVRQNAVVTKETTIIIHETDEGVEFETYVKSYDTEENK